MMIDPSHYAKAMSKASLEELIEERECLIREIEEYEKGDSDFDEIFAINPSPEVVYKCNLKYLKEVCKLIDEKSNM